MIAFRRARAPFWEDCTKLMSKRNPEILLSNECGDEWDTARKVKVELETGDSFELLKDAGVTDALDRAIASRQASRPMA